MCVHSAVALVMYGGTSHHISTLHLTSSSGCFESPPPSFQCKQRFLCDISRFVGVSCLRCVYHLGYCDCDNVGVVTTADDDHGQYI